MHAGLLIGFTIAPHRSKDQAKHSRTKRMQSAAGKAHEGKAQAKHSKTKHSRTKHSRAQQRQSIAGKAHQGKAQAKYRQSTAGQNTAGKAQAKHRQSTVHKSYLFQSSQTVAAEDCKKTLSYTAAFQRSAFCQSCALAVSPQSSSSVESQCCRPSLIFFTP